VADLRALIRLDTPGITGQIRETLATLGVRPRAATRRRGQAASA
jgi:hypothetical protein